MEKLNLNLNARPDPILAKLPETKSQSHLTRITLIAIPFLSLYRPTRIGLSVITGSVQVISLWKSDQKRHEKLLKSSAYAIMIYFSIYRPQATLAITVSVQTFSDIREKKVYDILSRMIYFYSIYSNRPEFIVASLALEAGKELKEAYEEYNNENHLEVVGKLLMVALRCYQTKEEVSRVSQRYFAKTVTQEDWDKLPKKDLSKMKLKDRVFERIDFSDSDLSKATIENVTFNHCKMEDIFLHKVKLTKVVWNHCQLKAGTFYCCNGSDLNFKGCDLTRFCMSESNFSRLYIEGSTLYGASFLNAWLHDSILKGCDLVDVLLCNANFMQIDCSKNQITKPVIALTWDFTERGSWGSPVPDVLEEQGSLTLKFPIYPKDIDKNALRKEVQKKLQSYSSYRLSRAQELLDDPHMTPEIEAIRRKAMQVMSYADGLILSGGEDVETEFYSDSFDGWDYRRSLMEFAVIHHRKPVLGICRGCQVLNTYFGGTIKDVPYQGKKEPLDYNKNEPLAKKLKGRIKRPVLGFSAHSQAADKMGRDLRVVLTKRGIVKAFMNRDQSVIGTQFHPEKYICGKLIREEMGKRDVKKVVAFLAYSLKQQPNVKQDFFETGPLLTNEEIPQLTSKGGAALIKYCNQALRTIVEGFKKLEPNQIFFKIFLDRVRTSRGDSSLRQSESALAG